MKIKKVLSVMLIIILSISTHSMAFAAEEKSDPVGIYSVEDLNKIRDDLDGSYILMNDIDLSNTEWLPVGTDVAPFEGIFDGNNKTIKGVSITKTVESLIDFSAGFFAFISSAEIKNLTIADANITVNETDENFYSVGTVAGNAKFSSIENCNVSGSINVDVNGTCNAGGIVGHTLDSTISKCNSVTDIKVNGKNELYVGGIAGCSFSKISLCSNSGNIAVDNANSQNKSKDIIEVGGISGIMFLNDIDNSYNTGNIVMNVISESACVGGISGISFSVTNCYNIGEITFSNQAATESTAGIAGSVVFSFTGMETEDNRNSYVSNSYCLDNVSKALGNTDSLKVKNTKILTDDEMKIASSYIGFDFKNIWTMGEDGYPVLRTEPGIPEIEQKIVVDMEIAYLPIKNRIVFGAPAALSGIIVKLTYSDGTTQNVAVEQGDDGYYYVENQRIINTDISSTISYGLLTTDLVLESSNLTDEYWYLSIPTLSSVLGEILKR